MPEQLPEPETRSRQEQILVLASEGLTDKEIAARLKLSPETVGTYWRRILSKYAAASRTEVVAKVLRIQAEADLGHLTQVSEGLKEVADHLLYVIQEQNNDGRTGAEPASDAANILEAIPDPIVAVDTEGFLTFINRPGLVHGEIGEPFEWCVAAVDRELLRDTLSQVLDAGGSQTISLSLIDGDTSKSYRASVCRKQPNGAAIAMYPCHT